MGYFLNSIFFEQLTEDICSEFSLRHPSYAGEFSVSHHGSHFIFDLSGITAEFSVDSILGDGTFADLSAEDMLWLYITNTFSELIEIKEGLT